jgi:hypothetical protein
MRLRWEALSAWERCCCTILFFGGLILLGIAAVDALLPRIVQP